MNEHAQKLEALLYVSGGEVRKSILREHLSLSEQELSDIVRALKEALTSRGLTLVETKETLSLRTAPQHAEFVAEVQQKDLQKDIGDAGLEVLAIVLYKGGATTLEISHIRGVNSAGTLRNLTVRGLLERSRYEKDGRQTFFAPSAELLAHLGVAGQEELPEFTKIQNALEAFENRTKEHGDEQDTTTKE